MAGCWSAAVSTSLVDGVFGGLAIAALGVFADWAALGIAGFIPSISREVEIVDAGVGTIVGETIGAASFLALGICLAVEALDRVRLNPMVSTAVVAIGAGLVAASNQNSILAGLPLIAGQAAGAAIAVVLYRRRGFLAAWVAALVAGLTTDAMAARSLEDPELLQVEQPRDVDRRRAAAGRRVGRYCAPAGRCSRKYRAMSL